MRIEKRIIRFERRIYALGENPVKPGEERPPFRTCVGDPLCEGDKEGPIIKKSAPGIQMSLNESIHNCERDYRE